MYVSTSASRNIQCSLRAQCLHGTELIMSSSSEEESERLREALDPTFFSNDIYISNKCSEETKQVQKLPPSLRNQQQPKSFNPLEIRVTPEFRAHVSKHLNKLLEKLIYYTDETKKRKLKSQNKLENAGVKLLRNSKDIVNAEEKHLECSHSNKSKFMKRKRRKIESDSSDEERRAKEVAVSPEWILSGKATEGWAPCTKGKVEVISIKLPKSE